MYILGVRLWMAVLYVFVGNVIPVLRGKKHESLMVKFFVKTLSIFCSLLSLSFKS